MKRLIGVILVTVIFALQLSGCGMDEKEQPSASNVEELQGAGETEGQDEAADSAGAGDAAAVLNSGGQDNSLDAYSAVINTPLGMDDGVRPAGKGTSQSFLGVSRAYYFKKHLFDNVEECWDELSFATAEGEKGQKSFGRENQLWDIGPAAGTDDYVTFDMEAGGSEGARYFLTQRGENYEVVREFSLDFLNGSDPSDVIVDLSCFAVDHSGTVHLLWNRGEEQQYQLVSATGEILAEYVPKDGYIEGLVPLYDGRIAFRTSKTDQEGQGAGRTLQCMHEEAGSPVVLAASEEESYFFTLFDESTLLYADQEGVWRSGLSGDNPELLYRWSSHGIAVVSGQGISAMQANEEGWIELIYRDSQKDNYLCLKPTTEESEIYEITLAASPMRASIYEPLVVEFNKRYPNWHIELKSDYDETALLVALTAGKGPVLIDTFLTGFEEQEELWEPLDTVIGQPGMEEELQLSALEMGKIDGVLYGIVTDFSLRTLVVGSEDLKDWDYDAFLRCIEDRPELDAVFNLYGGDYGSYFIVSFFSHGLDDAYFLDAEAGTTNFDSSEFRRALALAKKYCVREDAVSPGSSLLEGKVLCNELSIRKPEQLALYRACYGEDANYIGYPAKDGAVVFMEGGGSPLAIRRTAAEEEKKAADAFVGLCLSYEGQSLAAKDLNFGLSVRRDVLEEQINAMNKDTEAFVSGFSPFTLGDYLNVDLDRKTLLDMIDRARPLKYFPKELRKILYEELEQYFSGAITEDMLIDRLESRVGLYLGERN